MQVPYDVQALYDGEASGHVGPKSSTVHVVNVVVLIAVLEPHTNEFLQRWSMRFWIRPLVDRLWSWTRLSILLAVGVARAGAKMFVAVTWYCCGQVRERLSRHIAS